MMGASDSFCEAVTASRAGSFEKSAELFNGRFFVWVDDFPWFVSLFQLSLTRHQLKHPCVSDLIIERSRRTTHAWLRLSTRFPTNQYLVYALWLTNEIAPPTYIFSLLKCTWTHSLCRLPASRFTRWFGVSYILLPLAHSTTPPFRSLLIHCICRANAYFSTPWSRLTLYTTASYCWWLVFLGL